MKPLKYIVSRVVDQAYNAEQQYRPSGEPALHNSPEEALKEAERLAVANPGFKYAVLSPVYVTLAPPPPVPVADTKRVARLQPGILSLSDMFGGAFR